MKVRKDLTEQVKENSGQKSNASYNVWFINFRSSKEYGVPQTTLQDRVLGEVTHGTEPGPKRYLNRVEERISGRNYCSWVW